jgi:hypothetical protein
MGGNANLDENNLAYPFGASSQKAFQRQELQGDPLEGFQSINGTKDCPTWNTPSNILCFHHGRLMVQDLV